MMNKKYEKNFVSMRVIVNKTGWSGTEWPTKQSSAFNFSKYILKC